jgi:hypothetical protein
MVDGYTLKKSSGGVLLKNADGILIKECIGCPYCDVSTPSTFDVVFSGLTESIPLCCQFKVGTTIYQQKITSLSLDPNDTFELTNSEASPCIWTHEESCTGEMDVWPSGSGCAGDPLQTIDIDTFHISFALASGYDLEAWFTGPGGTTPLDVVNIFQAFSASGRPEEDWDCDDSLGPLSNDIGACTSSGIRPILFRHGTGTLSP